MLPIETDTLVDNCLTSCMIDQIIDNECFCTNNNPNSQPMTSNNFANKTISEPNVAITVNKSYELSDKFILESYFSTNDMENANEFVSDYANNYPNGVILVLNEMEIQNETELLTSQLKSQLKHIIVCNNKRELKSLNHKPIFSQNLKQAAQTAYNMAIDGQAILFQGVSKNFDLLSHIY